MQLILSLGKWVKFCGVDTLSRWCRAKGLVPLNEEDFLLPPPIFAYNHPSFGLALFSLPAELSRCGGNVGRTWHRFKLWNDPTMSFEIKFSKLVIIEKGRLIKSCPGTYRIKYTGILSDPVVLSVTNQLACFAFRYVSLIENLFHFVSAKPKLYVCVFQ